MKHLLPAILVFSALAFVASAKADDTLLTLSGDAAFGGGDAGNLVIGLAFTPDVNITVTQLGAFAGGTPVDAPGDTSPAMISDGVTTQDFTAVLYSFDETYAGDSMTSGSGVGTVIANAVIPTGTAVNGDNVAFTTLDTPITLLAGHEYFIGSDGGTPSDLHDVEILQAGNGSGDFAANIGFFDAASDITFDNSGFSGVGGALAPTSVDVGTVQNFTLANVYLAGDLRYTVAAPEPSALAYGAVGLAALAFLLRQRRSI